MNYTDYNGNYVFSRMEKSFEKKTGEEIEFQS